ncbi:hypothetical protein L3X38_011379 [Prunus dulcis]|uniref:Uncharacterized protein n=1 Tax=Prunus dulcis TaxID=3755 RepID=A0AAD4WH90_PRUDU|nr:hypothetical protein L3X38_011379 [Prunus dulcis]
MANDTTSKGGSLCCTSPSKRQALNSKVVKNEATNPRGLVEVLLKLHHLDLIESVPKPQPGDIEWRDAEPTEPSLP